MPFDATPQSESDATTLFRQRREAAAALWRGVPRRKFSFQKWECRTTACALGWLAKLQHDGWKFTSVVTFGGRMPATTGSSGDAFDAAAAYFGMARSEALDCFGAGFAAHATYGCRPASVTPAQVAAAVLAMPYTVPPHGA